MNSLDLVSEINSRINELDEKINKTSKSASVAFSYLYSKVENIEDIDARFSDFDERLINLRKNLNEKASITDKKFDTFELNNEKEIKSFNTKLESISSDIGELSKSIVSFKNEINTFKNNVTKLTDKLNEYNKLIDSNKKEIQSIKEDIDEFKKDVETRIVEIPDTYILVDKEPSKLASLWDKITYFFYVMFHQKQIREERKRLEEEERKKREEEERKRLEEEERKRKEMQEKINKKNKIKELLKK